MKRYIQSIHINKVRHLQDIEIDIPDDDHAHLLITGRNGSGKTSLLEAIRDHISNIQSRKDLYFLDYGDYIANYKERLSNSIDPIEKIESERMLHHYMEKYDTFYGRVKVTFDDLSRIISGPSKEPFIVAMYAADRNVQMTEPTNPTKPKLESHWQITQSASDQFLLYISDLKIQEALARNEQQYVEADSIKEWFDTFEELLKEIFGDPELKLSFNYKDYSFEISTASNSFKFTQLSDGFAAIIDIITDLILKMSSVVGRTMMLYDVPGIVLIDEVETHLHLALQRQVLPLLTRVFPKIQFIVTTHSPFVLNSIPSATIFDLEHQQALTNLSDYSYEALTEGYFEVSTKSSYLEGQLNRLKALLQKVSLDITEEFELKELIQEFNKVSEGASPKIVGEFEALKLKFQDKFGAVIGHDSN